MNLLSTIFSALLFFAFVPGVIFSIPAKGSKKLVTFTHATLFALVYYFTHKFVYRLKLEGFKEGGFGGSPSCTVIPKVCYPGATVCVPQQPKIETTKKCTSPWSCRWFTKTIPVAPVCIPSPETCVPEKKNCY